jgi:hypothetical protein
MSRNNQSSLPASPATPRAASPALVGVNDFSAKQSSVDFDKLGSAAALCMLCASISEAKRFNDQYPESKKHSDQSSGMTGCSDDSSAYHDQNKPTVTNHVIWEQLQAKLLNYWKTDRGAISAKYNQCVAWLAKLLLWDINSTFKDVGSPEEWAQTKRKAQEGL